VKISSRFEWRHQSRLLDERDRLQRLHKGLMNAATNRHEYEPHDIVDDEAAIQADAIESRLAAVNDALERIDSGTYGLCKDCTSPIADERVEALPTTTSCRSCAD